MSEAQSMVALEAAMENLDAPARQRVLTWALSRWCPQLESAAQRQQSAPKAPDPIGFPEPVFPAILGFPLTSDLPFDRVTRADRPLEDGLLPRAGAFAVHTGDVNADKLSEDDTDGGMARLKNAERELTYIAERITADSKPDEVASSIVEALGAAMTTYIVQAFSSEVLCESHYYSGKKFIYTDEGKLFAQAIWEELGRLLSFHVEPPRESATPNFAPKSDAERALDLAEGASDVQSALFRELEKELATAYSPGMLPIKFAQRFVERAGKEATRLLAIGSTAEQFLAYCGHDCILRPDQDWVTYVWAALEIVSRPA